MKYILYSLIITLVLSCSLKGKLIHKLYRYERNQFKEPSKARNVRALKMWKDNHEFIFRDKEICDSFILIESFDSSKRINKHINKYEYYLSEYRTCFDTGYVYNDLDSITTTLISYKNSRDYVTENIYDSIEKGITLGVELSAPSKRVMVQIVRIKRRKIIISGFNLNRAVRAVDKI